MIFIHSKKSLISTLSAIAMLSISETSTILLQLPFIENNIKFQLMEKNFQNSIKN